MPILSRVLVGSFSASVLALGLLAGCTVTTNNAQPEAVPDPASTAAAVSTSAPAVSSTTAAPPDSTKMPDVTTPPSGDWMKPNPNGKADGEACSKPDDCKSGVCEGEGCDKGPKCVAANRMCTRDLVQFCGCDGKTFSSSGSCPSRPYKKKGSCN